MEGEVAILVVSYNADFLKRLTHSALDPSGDFVLPALRPLRPRDTVVFPSFQQCTAVQ